MQCHEEGNEQMIQLLPKMYNFAVMGSNLSSMLEDTRGVEEGDED